MLVIKRGGSKGTVSQCDRRDGLLHRTRAKFSIETNWKKAGLNQVSAYHQKINDAVQAEPNSEKEPSWLTIVNLNLSVAASIGHGLVSLTHTHIQLGGGSFYIIICLSNVYMECNSKAFQTIKTEVF